ncbi:MAG: ribokinase [Candidatus Sumerlaeia bacterium]
MKILNYGSLNIDQVYRVPRIVRPGETLSSRSLKTFAGGKGANQSMALARAGASVWHAGKVGDDGAWLTEKLQKAGVETHWIRKGDTPTGNAIIQVDDAGQNAIFLFPGGNREIDRDEVDETLESFGSGDWILLQNEINLIPFIILAACDKDMKVCLNPAPFGEEVLKYPLGSVDMLVLNETEGEGLTGESNPESILQMARAKASKAEIVLTLGEKGAMVMEGSEITTVPGKTVKALDTTAAGDTFIGYYLARRSEGLEVRDSLEQACAAAALSVTRSGAQDSIPKRAEVKNYLAGNEPDQESDQPDLV